MINSYNRIAFLYYPLARIFFGRSLYRIQVSCLNELPRSGKYLIIGGGNGEILPRIHEHGTHIQVDYLEASSQMIAMAKKQVPSTLNIQFFHTDQLTDAQGSYDAILLPFVLDTLPEQACSRWIETLSQKLQQGGFLLITDFYKPHHVLQALTLKCAILFFRLFTSHRPKHLPDPFAVVAEHHFKLIKTSTLRSGFLRSSLYSWPKY